LTRTVQTEDVMVVSAICAGERAHILHHAKDWNADLFEEVNAPDSVS